jgi:hypothetical protein
MYSVLWCESFQLTPFDIETKGFSVFRIFPRSQWLPDLVVSVNNFGKEVLLKGKACMIDLLALTSLDQLLFILKKIFIFFQNKVPK